MLQGKQNRNVGGRETVLATGQWERWLFALVSKDRARHCLHDGAEEARSQGAALVQVLCSPRRFGLKLQPPPREGVGMVSLSRCFIPQS